MFANNFTADQLKLGWVVEDVNYMFTGHSVTTTVLS